MTDYYKVAKKTFYETMAAFGLSKQTENGHEGLGVTVKGNPTEIVAGLTHLQTNLFRATLSMHVALANDGNSEFYHIQKYHELMQKVLHQEMLDLTEKYANDGVHNSVTVVQ